MKLMNWPEMMEQLVGMIQAADESTTPDVYCWALSQLQRIGEHLEKLPHDHSLRLPTPTEFFEAKRAIAEAV